MKIYGPFVNREPRSEDDLRLASCGIGFLESTAHDLCWYEYVKSVKDESKLILVLGPNDAILSIIKSENIDSIFPVNLRVVALDSVPDEIIGEEFKWTYNGQFNKNMDFIIFERETYKSEEIDYASSQIQHIQDQIDLGSTSKKLSASMRKWKQYRVDLKEIDTYSVQLNNFPTRPE